MLLLAIDTSGPACAVALARSGDGVPEIVAQATEVIGRGHAERLMPMIDVALAEGGATFEDLDRIAVTTGPGSFTGIRVGIAAARGLALALDIPAVGIGSLDAIAFPITRSHRSGTAVAVLDAKRGELFALAQDLKSGGTLIEATSFRPEGLADALRAATRPLILAGNGARILTSFFRDTDATIASDADFPDISDVVALGLMAEVDGAPVPHYARGADAKPQAGKIVARR
jgi:tRNA threonylcarbamoyladenosine biosynthesis protein TsaB